MNRTDLSCILVLVSLVKCDLQAFIVTVNSLNSLTSSTYKFLKEIYIPLLYFMWKEQFYLDVNRYVSAEFLPCHLKFETVIQSSLSKGIFFMELYCYFQSLEKEKGTCLTIEHSICQHRETVSRVCSAERKPNRFSRRKHPLKKREIPGEHSSLHVWVPLLLKTCFHQMAVNYYKRSRGDVLDSLVLNGLLSLYTGAMTFSVHPSKYKPRNYRTAKRMYFYIQVVN